MKHESLNDQQKYVLGEVYDGIRHAIRFYRHDPQQILNRCSYCQCSHIEGEARTAFERALREACDSNAFTSVFACWNSDHEIVGLFGLIGGEDQSSCCFSSDDEIVFLGEYATRGSIPSYIRNDSRNYRLAIVLTGPADLCSQSCSSWEFISPSRFSSKLPAARFK